MTNRIALAAVILTLSAPVWAGGEALREAGVLANGGAAAYDGGCSGGSCGAQPTACQGESCRINAAGEGATRTGGYVFAPKGEPRPTMVAEVPAPGLGDDAPNAKKKPGFFSKLFTGKSLMYGAGGALAGAGIGLLFGGPIGALIGGLIGAIGGIALSKFLAK